MANDNALHPISRQTLVRLPEYHAYLISSACEDMQYISAGRLAQALGKSEIQVRKDLAAVSSGGGRPKLGFDRQALIADIDMYLGLDSVDSAVLVGVGSLGLALIHYDGFKTCGVELTAAFDRDKAKIGTRVNGVYIADYEELVPLVRRLKVHIGIITVPAEAAQGVADRLVEAGVLAIWNFAPIRLELPGDIIVRNEDMSCSLALLSHHLAQKLQEDK